MSAEQSIWAEIIAFALDLLRFDAGVRRKITSLLLEMQRELVARLATEDLTEYNQKRLNALLNESKKIIDDNYDSMSELMTTKLKGLAEVSAKQAGRSVENVLGVKVGVGLPTETHLKTLVSDTLIQGAPSKAWWKRQAGDTAFRFSQAVRQGVAQGETTQQIVARVVGRVGEPGVMDISRQNAYALVNTSTQAVAAKARLAFYKENADIIKGVRQVSTLDSKTTDICKAYDGAEFTLDGEPINTTLPFNSGVPRHWNCRSVEVPITKTFKEMGVKMGELKRLRASEDGQVDGNMKFEDFLKTKSREWQDEALGKGRAELWREGKITIRDLLDQSGNPLTLKQLKAKYG